MITGLSIIGAVVGAVVAVYAATRGRAADREALTARSRLHPATAGGGAEPAEPDHDQEEGDEG